MKVSNAWDVPNQFLIEDGNKSYFQSYNSIIALKDDNEGQVYLDEKYWDYSRTTMKYLHKFLRTESKKEIESRIKSGRYILLDLNK